MPASPAPSARCASSASTSCARRRCAPARAEDASSCYARTAVLLSAAAAEALRLGKGDELELVVGAADGRAEVAGVLTLVACAASSRSPTSPPRSGASGRLGELNRLDLRLQTDADRNEVRQADSALLPPGVHVSAIETLEEASAYPVALLPREPERAGDGRALHRRLPRVLGAGAGGRAAPRRARAAARAGPRAAASRAWCSPRRRCSARSARASGSALGYALALARGAGSRRGPRRRHVPRRCATHRISPSGRLGISCAGIAVALAGSACCRRSTRRARRRRARSRRATSRACSRALRRWPGLGFLVLARRRWPRPLGPVRRAAALRLRRDRLPARSAA